MNNRVEQEPNQEPRGSPIDSVIVESIQALHATKPTVLVAIDGGGGSGKTTFAKNLAASLSGPVRIISMDDYYIKGSDFKPLKAEGPVYEHFDIERLKREVLTPLSATENPANETVIVEGVGTLGKALRDYFDYKIWLEVPEAIRRSRGLQRDGDGFKDVWNDRYIPEDERYKREQQPQDAADYIVESENS